MTNFVTMILKGLYQDLNRKAEKLKYILLCLDQDNARFHCKGIIIYLN